MLSCFVILWVLAGSPAARPEIPPPSSGADPAPASTPSAAPVAPSSSYRAIPAGTPIVVELTDQLSASRVKPGDRFGLRLAEAVKVDGLIVLPAGLPGVGEVIDAGAPGISGRPARLVVAGRYLEGGGAHIKIQSLKFGGAGHANTDAAFGAVVAFGVVGMLVPGGDLVYPAGARASAKIAAADNDPVAGAVEPPPSGPLNPTSEKASPQ